jgi:hypothetical protein
MRMMRGSNTVLQLNIFSHNTELEININFILSVLFLYRFLYFSMKQEKTSKAQEGQAYTSRE